MRGTKEWKKTAKVLLNFIMFKVYTEPLASPGPGCPAYTFELILSAVPLNRGQLLLLVHRFLHPPSPAEISAVSGGWDHWVLLCAAEGFPTPTSGSSSRSVSTSLCQVLVKSKILLSWASAVVYWQGNPAGSEQFYSALAWPSIDAHNKLPADFMGPYSICCLRHGVFSPGSFITPFLITRYGDNQWCPCFMFSSNFNKKGDVICLHWIKGIFSYCAPGHLN